MKREFLKNLDIGDGAKLSDAAIDAIMAEYKSVFCGMLTEAEFCRYRVKACAYIRRITCGRSNDTDAVKMAICEVAEALAHEEQDVVASESNDGISVTYRADNVSAERRLYQAALLHLSGTGLLYRGCYE